MNYDKYDHIVLAFSGGKDSLACLLQLIEDGQAHKLTLLHHDIDGDSANLFDWPVTPAYVRAVAKHFNLPLVMSGREGGFEAELRKRESKSGAYYWYEEASQNLIVSDFKGQPNTRRRMPAKTANLQTRWCSPFLKIDLGHKYLRAEFNNTSVLFVTGERRQESSNRAKYNEFETHRCNSKTRLVDHWRPVIDWKEEDVWAIIEKHGINPHPAYKLGWGRLSCMCCIFGSVDQWASIRQIAPTNFQTIADMEQDFEHTIDNKRSVTEMADKGAPYSDMSQADIDQARSITYYSPITLDDWQLPAGAFGESNGPS